MLLGANSSMWVLLGNGDGTFQSPKMNTAETTSIVVADFNGDGIADLAVNFVGGLGVYLGNGSGTFQSFLPVEIFGPDFPLVSITARSQS